MFHVSLIRPQSHITALVGPIGVKELAMGPVYALVAARSLEMPHEFLDHQQGAALIQQPFRFTLLELQLLPSVQRLSELVDKNLDKPPGQRDSASLWPHRPV